MKTFWFWFLIIQTLTNSYANYDQRKTFYNKHSKEETSVIVCK